MRNCGAYFFVSLIRLMEYLLFIRLPDVMTWGHKVQNRNLCWTNFSFLSYILSLSHVHEYSKCWGDNEIHNQTLSVVLITCRHNSVSGNKIFFKYYILGAQTLLRYNIVSRTYPRNESRYLVAFNSSINSGFVSLTPLLCSDLKGLYNSHKLPLSELDRVQ